jgi:hypothetical protein
MRYVWKMSWMWEEPPQHARTTSSEDEEEVWRKFVVYLYSRSGTLRRQTFDLVATRCNST